MAGAVAVGTTVTFDCTESFSAPLNAGDVALTVLSLQPNGDPIGTFSQNFNVTIGLKTS